MSNWKKYLPFIILNIIISAITTIIVMSLWNQSTPPIDYPTSSFTSNTISPADLVATLSTTPEIPDEIDLPPLDIEIIKIENIFGVDDIDNEEIIIQRSGDGELWLDGWTLVDEDENVYSFPKLLLNKDGAVTLYTRDGIDSVVKLYWGLDQAVWQNGETATIIDPEGNIRATFQIP